MLASAYHPMKHYILRLKGGHPLPARISSSALGRTFIRAALAIGLVAYLAARSGTPLVLGSFGASCVLLFSFPDSPFSQPRSVIGGHFLTSLTGLVFLNAFGAEWWSMALALACAISLMHITQTVHPPAGSNPIIVMLSVPGWSFLLTPTLLGSALLVAAALVFNNWDGDSRYPRYW